MKHRKGIIKNCNCCNKEFYVPQYRINTAKFCSLFCQNHAQYDRKQFNCKQCNKVFTDSPSRLDRKYCSEECYQDSQRIHKTTKEKRRAQKVLVNNKRGINWSTNNRKHVFKLKEAKCEICGYNEYDFCLDIHHIDNNPNNNHINNLAVICVMCHRKLHKKIIEYNV